MEKRLTHVYLNIEKFASLTANSFISLFYSLLQTLFLSHDLSPT